MKMMDRAAGDVWISTLVMILIQLTVRDVLAFPVKTGAIEADIIPCSFVIILLC